METGEHNIWALRGREASVPRTIDAKDRALQWWVIDSTSVTWTIGASNELPDPLDYFHQYRVTFDFTTKPINDPHGSPFVAYYSLGSLYNISDHGSVTRMVDAGTTIRYSTCLSDSNATVRWLTNSNTFRADETKSLDPSYQEQFYVLVRSNSSSGGRVYPGSAWRDALTKIKILAVARSGYAFDDWVGQGDGSYSGSSNSAYITINAPIDETAYFSK